MIAYVYADGQNVAFLKSSLGLHQHYEYEVLNVLKNILNLLLNDVIFA